MNRSVPPIRPSSLVDTRAVYCGDKLEQLKKLADVRGVVRES
jgi:hypothetical protein